MYDKTTSYAALNLQALKQKKGRIISSQEALRDIKPILWDDEVLKNKKKITIVESKDRSN